MLALGLIALGLGVILWARLTTTAGGCADARDDCTEMAVRWLCGRLTEPGWGQRALLIAAVVAAGAAYSCSATGRGRRRSAAVWRPKPPCAAAGFYWN